MRPHRPARCLLVLAPLALFACGGDDNPVTGAPAGGGKDPPVVDRPSVSGYAVFDNGAAATYRQSAEFNRSDPSESEDAYLRRQFGLPALCQGVGNPRCAKGNAHALQRLEAAHTATLSDGRKVTGAGTTIAVVDNGYRTGHQDLAGKSIARYLGGAAGIGVDDHGTAVAAIAAAPADGRGMVGVAPDAALHLSSWEDVGTGSLLPHLAGATRDAAAHRAVVQNNSWSWDTEVRADAEARAFAQSGAADYAAFRAANDGGSAGEWRALFSAYDDFQKTGVLVFANSNTSDLGDASAWAALPNFVPELGEAWIAVSNALFAVDRDDGAILKADLLSAPCGSAARFCLTTDGTLVAPTATSDTAQALGTGTSYAAPQVAGDIALLAQAFPHLEPGEWTSRLLATARREWADFQSSISGETIFAPGVRRSYSRLFGHGVPDIKAALSPVGGLSIASGDSVHSGPRTAIGGGIELSAPVIGNAVAKAIANRRLMAVDALGTDFYLRGREIAARPAARGRRGLAAATSRRFDDQKRLADSFAFIMAPSASADALRETASAKFYFSLGFAEAGTGHAFVRLMPLGPGDYLQFTGALEPDINGGGGGKADFTLTRLVDRGRFSSEVSLSAGHGAGRLFGQQAQGPFMASEASGYASAALTLGAALGNGWSLAGFTELGIGYAQDSPGALLEIGPLAYGDAGLLLGRKALLSADDTLRIYAGTRPTPLAGKARLRLPVGRDARGKIDYETIDVALANADLPLRVGLSYSTRLPANLDLQVEANTDLRPGEPDERQLDFAFRLKKTF